MKNLFRRGDRQVKIVPNQDFLDGPIRFEKGKVYKVDLGHARYFERNGWLEGSVANPPAASLEVDDSVLGTRGGM